MLTILIAATALLLKLIPGVAELFQYDSSAIVSGQLWRIITGHFTHWNLSHLLWDTAVFAALGWLTEREGHRQLLLAVFGSAVAISIAMLCTGAPPIYRGLSGIDSALFSLTVICRAAHAWRAGGWRTALPWVSLGLAFTAKLSFEAVTARTIFVDAPAAGFIPVPLAHAVGAAVGSLVALWSIAHPRTKKPPTEMRRGPWSLRQLLKGVVVISWRLSWCSWRPSRGPS